MRATSERCATLLRRVGLILLVLAAALLVSFPLYRSSELTVSRVLHVVRQFRASISIELADAPPGPTPKSRVFKWLRIHAPDINRAADRFKVDRRAIAAVIAYEALEDVSSSRFWMPSSVGPGKVHYRDVYIEGRSYFSSTNPPLSQIVETLGLLPTKSISQRKQILATAAGSALYIAAIFSVFQDIAARRGQHIQCRPDLLATMYTAWTFSGIERELTTLRGQKLVDNIAGLWVHRNLRYFDSAVGLPNMCESSNKIRGARYQRIRLIPFSRNGYTHGDEDS